jgi:hypothetical protein
MGPSPRHNAVRINSRTQSRALFTFKIRAEPAIHLLSFSVIGIPSRSKLWLLQSKSEFDEALLKAHGLHLGLYRRVADKLGVDAQPCCQWYA